jgi:TonB family protein
MSEQVSCEHFESFAVLYALGELEAPLRAAAEEHARACPDCAALLRREIALAEMLASGARAAEEQEPSDLLLASCRSRLSRTLDTATAPIRPRAWTTLFSLRDWIAAFRFSPRVHPAWSVAALLLIGALAGLAGRQGIGRAPLQQWGPTAMTVLAAPAPAPVVPAQEDATPQPAAQAQLPAPSVPEDPHVYSADDAGMNDASSQRTFQADVAGGPTQRQEVRTFGLDHGMSPAWRNAPPPSLAPPAVWEAPERGRLAELSRRMESLWWGGVRIDPAQQQERLVRALAPEYPEVARRAGIEGQVTLLLRVGEDGSVQDTQLLSGEPVLGRAAAEAVEQWRYSPLRIGGRPVSILTSVTFDFRLR